MPRSPFSQMYGRKGGLTTASRYDVRELTQAARTTFLARFEREVDPDGTLPVDERLRRARAARKVYFTDLAIKSAKARAKKRSRRIPVPRSSPTSPASERTSPKGRP